MSSFTCPQCGETYAPHFREPDNTGRCQRCAATGRGVCIWAAEHPEHLGEHPCSYLAVEKPGEPCRYCGDPVPASGPCPACWLSFDGMPLADIRAVFAADGFDTTITRSEP